MTTPAVRRYVEHPKNATQRGALYARFKLPKVTQGILSGAVRTNNNSSAYLEPWVSDRENKCKHPPLENEKALIIITCNIQLSSPWSFPEFSPFLTRTPYSRDTVNIEMRKIHASAGASVVHWLHGQNCKWLATYNWEYSMSMYFDTDVRVKGFHTVSTNQQNGKPGIYELP